MTAPSTDILTTGAVAKIAGVAMRTVAKWFDSGRLRGYRIPGSLDRRIPREHLIDFLRDNNMPHALERLEVECREVVLLVGVPATSDLATALQRELPGRPVAVARNLFEAGLVYRDRQPGIVVIDLAGVGRGEGKAAAQRLAQLESPPVMVAMVGEDCGRSQWLPLREAGFARVCQHPVDPVRLAALVTGVGPGEEACP